MIELETLNIDLTLLATRFTYRIRRVIFIWRNVHIVEHYTKKKIIILPQ